MKRLGVAAIMGSAGKHSMHLLLGRRGKDPNRGLYVLPGGGVQNNESLEEALCREVMEETGLEIKPRYSRWNKPDLIEMPDRIILVVDVTVQCRWRPKGAMVAAGFFDDEPRDGSDLYDVAWFGYHDLPPDISPVVVPILARWGWHPGKAPQ
jgi:ADP-ribose pyrophosphatase YjhB (NUDIX family)